jgi:aldose 1-epimerase
MDPTSQSRDARQIVIAPFGTTPAGETAEIFTLTNAQGLVVRATNFGGIIVSLLVPDRAGDLADVVLGYDSLEGYLHDSRYLGGIVGRFANRIANARFTVDGTTYQLAANEGPHHLHGGFKGFNKVVWHPAPLRTDRTAGLTLSHTSPDGTEGYPGTLNARVTYTLTDRNELIVDYLATTDQATPINLTQHSYFNLTGAGAGKVLDHLLQINADSMTPVDESLIPTGAIVPVAGGPFDFRAPTSIGARIGADDEQLHRGHGYDHNFVLNRRGPGLVHAARLVDPVSGRTLDIHTTEPGLQFYSGNFLDGRGIGKGGRLYGHRAGLCLEPQHYPDSPNRPGFPATILRPGSEYRSQTVFVFGITS